MKFMKYGYFDVNNREYVITRPDTPQPWMNFLGTNNRYCVMISNNAGGYSYHIDAKDKRLTRYRYNGLTMDRPGKYIYIHDRNSKDYWSASWQPVGKDLSKFKTVCRHGLGYTAIESEYLKIKTKVTYFVPVNKDYELWYLEIENLSNSNRELSIFGYTEFSMWNAWNDVFDLQACLNTARIEFLNNTVYHNSYAESAEGNIETKTPWKQNFGFFTANRKVNSFDVQRDIFIGKWRNESNPVAVENGKGANSNFNGGIPVGALELKITLKPNQKKEIVFALGVTEKQYGEKKWIKQDLEPKNVKNELSKLKKFWDEFLSVLQVKTPDEGFNVITNTWNRYQIKTDSDKLITWYNTGIGKGFGFRDYLQKSIALSTLDPKRAKEIILTLSAIQRSQGDAYHSYFPLSKTSSGLGFSDDPTWLPMAVCAYIKETGDFGILNKIIPFADKGKATLFVHLCRALKYVYTNTGNQGLPLLKTADWNDTLNPPGAAESQMVACNFVYAAKLFAELADYCGKKKEAAWAKKMAEVMSERINETCWDDEWYVRMFDGKGKKVGGFRKPERRIFLNAQSWAVIAGVADLTRGKTAMDSVRRWLASKYGLHLLWPPFEKYDPNIGEAGIFIPGFKENAGIFAHPNPWAWIAECILGRGDRAFEYYSSLNPYNRNEIPDIYQAEPYVFSQVMVGKCHPEFGRARNSWQTGAAPWAYVAGTQYILGIKPHYQGLEIDPCIPKKWKAFQAVRKFRGVTYNIKVENPAGLCKGIKEKYVNGKLYKEKYLPIPKAGSKVEVKIVLG